MIRDSMPSMRNVAAWAFVLATRGWIFARVMSHAETSIAGWRWRAGGPNLALYSYLASVVERGANPYTMVGGPIPVHYADYPPLLMATFGALAQFMPARLGVALVCIGGELALFAAVMRIAKHRQGLDWIVTVALVAANPLWIETELLNLQYKPLIAAGLVALYAAWSPVLAGVLSGAFILPAVLIPLRLRQDRAWKAAAVAVGVAALCWLPFFPEALRAVSERRGERYAMAPYGDSILADVPTQAIPWVLAAGTVAVAVLLLLRGNVVLLGSAALPLLCCLSPDVQMCRTMAFVLPILVCAPMSGLNRAGAFITCCASYQAYLFRWRTGGWDGDQLAHQPLWSLVVLYAPVIWALAVAIAYRFSPADQVATPGAGSAPARLPDRPRTEGTS